MIQSYDYIIIGGGSDGCVLAARLSENSKVNVLLLEAGGNDSHPFINIPAGFAKMTSSRYTWGLKTAPQKHANNREIPYAQARVIGGGSSINAEVFTRGNPADFDRWSEKEGCEGWSFSEIQKYFIRSEGNSIFAGDWHGTDGPLSVSNLANPQAMTLAFVKSCQQAGIPYNSDFNGSLQEGAGIYQTNIRNSKRCSASIGYLKPALGRSNLTVKTNCHAHRILFEGLRAVGVECEISGKLQKVHANMEVLVTSGAINSPKLMMLSGIGPAKELLKHDIKIVHDLPGVGKNLNDHYGIDIVAELTGQQSMDKYSKPHWAVMAGIQYMLYGSGPLASNIVEGGAFWYGDKSASIPDLQFHFLAGAGAEAGVPSVPKGRSGLTLNSYNLRPKARGTVKLRSNRIEDMAIVDPNFLGHPEDLKTSVEGIKMSIDIFQQKSLQKYIKSICYPNNKVKSQTDFEEYARTNGRTSYHPSGTCKMGIDEMAVLDTQLRVYGIDGLRICDCSIMPSLISSNTNASTIMVAEKASDMIRGNM